MSSAVRRVAVFEHPDARRGGKTATLSLAANRASKIDLLLADNAEQTNRIASKYADHLVHDSLEAIANGDVLGRDAQELANIAISARDRAK